MKCKKLITIGLVAILLSTSISIVSASETTTPKSVNKTNVFAKAKGFFQSFFGIFERIQQVFDKIFGRDTKKEEPQHPQPPKVLELTLELDEKYEYGQDILVTAVITNVGDKPINVIRPCFKLGNLDFLIVTPHGHRYSYLPEISTKPKREDVVNLGPEETTTCEIIINDGLFGPKVESSEEVVNPWMPGTYIISAHYEVKLTADSVDWAYLAIWSGELDSQDYRFEIVN